MKMKNNQKLIVSLLFFLLVFAFTFAPTSKLNASYWGENYAANIMQTMMERVFTMIQEFIRGSMKQMAIQSISSTISATISGGGGSEAMFIVNWKDALVTEPQQKTQLALNDFFSATTRGKGSSLNYVSSSGSGSGNYASKLLQSAKNATSSSAAPPTMDLQQYASGPSQVFDKKNWRGYNALISNPANNFGLTLNAMELKAATLAQEKKLASDQAISNQGFKPKMSGDSVMTPGSLVGQMQAQAQDIGNKAIASASSLPEIITSLVSRMAMQTLSQGIGNISGQIKTSISGKTQKINASLSKTVNGSSSGSFDVKQFNPQALFKSKF
jgi:hypothetical protein